jgi:hypothetical protein
MNTRRTGKKQELKFQVPFILLNPIVIIYIPAAFTISNSAFCIYGFYVILIVHSVNQINFVMVRCSVEVRTGFLNVI